MFAPDFVLSFLPIIGRNDIIMYAILKLLKIRNSLFAYRGRFIVILCIYRAERRFMTAYVDLDFLLPVS